MAAKHAAPPGEELANSITHGFGLALSLSVLNAYAVKHSQSRLSEITQQQTGKLAQEQQAELAARAALSNKNAAPVVAPAATNPGSLLIAPPTTPPAPAAK